MIDHGKALINEGDKIMKAGMEMMEGKIGKRGWWMEEGNLMGKGNQLKSKRETICQEGDKVVREGLKMMEDHMTETGELMLKEGDMLKNVGDMMIKESQMIMNKRT